jgi:hypothetical protein
MQTLTEKSQKLFDETAQLTGITEYGVSWEQLTSGQAEIPPQGARFDITFEGKIIGERLNGSIKGIDYLTVRADGRFDMNIQATITTDDGATIAFHESGVVAPQQDAPAELYLNMQFNTAHDQYLWLNGLQAWGRGTVDQSTGSIQVTSLVT